MDSKVICLALLGLWFGLAAPLMAQDRDSKEKKLALYGDVRFRIELDRDSRRSDGSKRDDRDRLRFRLRLGFAYQYNQYFSFGGRLRSNLPGAAQSPHITLGEELSPKSILIDKAYIQTTWKKGLAWLGKNSYPFWKQNEMFWDDSVTLEGVTVKHSLKIEKAGHLTATVGYYILENRGSHVFSDQAHLAAGQISLSARLGQTTLETAGGYFSFAENPEQEDVRLADLNYKIGVFGAKLSFTQWGTPLAVGMDYFQNVEKYPSTLFNADKKVGYVANVRVGSLTERGDWLIGYYYGYVEKYAVVARYAQDDWMRWGSQTITRSSNYKGHEFRAAIALGAKNNIVVRFYPVQGIDLESETAIATEDGKRFRIDWNIGF